MTFLGRKLGTADRFESFMHAACKHLVRKWLLQDTPRLTSKAVIPQGVISISRHVENLNSRKIDSEPVREFRTGHDGHHDVGQQEVDPAAMVTGETQCVSATGGDEDLVTSVAQNFRGHLAHRRIILDKQDRFAPGTEVECFLHGVRMRRLRNPRQERIKGAPRTHFAFDPDIAAALLRDAVNGGEPEAGAFAFFFRRKKWLENTRTRFRVHAVSRVANQEGDVLSQLEEWLWLS
jgi:hypothetical protein